MRILPTFKGFSLIERLREFGRADELDELGFVAFASPQGQQLLEEIHAERLTKTDWVSKAKYEALKAENELLTAQLKDALKQLSEITCRASEQIEKIQESLDV